MIRKLIVKELAQSYSALGKKQKLNFSKTKLYDVLKSEFSQFLESHKYFSHFFIAEAVRIIHKNVSDPEINKALSRALTTSTTWKN